MSRHLSDLAMERLFANEGPIPAHLNQCDVCWQRWVHLHADEGRPVPRRLQLHTSRTPWIIAAVSTTVAIAASAALVLMPRTMPNKTMAPSLSPAPEAMAQPEAPPGSTVAPPMPAPRTAPAPRIEPKPKGVSAPPTAPAYSPKHDDAAFDRAVKEEIQRRALEKTEKAIGKWEDHIWDTLGSHIRFLLDEGEIVEGQADDIERLIQDEMEQVFELKQLSITQQITPEEGMEEYKLIRQATDDALTALLGEEGAAELRATLEKP